jgi:sugar transferase EpsL
MRSFDFIVSFVLLVILAPLFLMVGLLLLLSIGSPIIFKQQRPGLLGKPFTLYKFRTMKNEYSPSGDLLPDGARLTKVGQFLRSTSLDELPELFNVLVGDMSLVGPRPLLMEYLPLYTTTQARRHEVRPGITGWAQVNGRNAVSWEERFEMDVWYVDNRTLFLNFKIMWMTVLSVLKKEGISKEGHATMPKFTGTKGGL